MPGRGIQHVDLAVSDVDRSLAFYMDLLGPLGLKEEERYPIDRMGSASRSSLRAPSGPRASTGTGRRGSIGPQGNRAVVQEFYDQWNSGAIDFERLVHPDVANHQPDTNPETGIDKFRYAIEGVMGAVPDSEWTIMRLIAEDDFVVCHNRWSGTYGGKVFRGVPTSQGERFSVEHVHICPGRPRDDAEAGRDPHVRMTSTRASCGRAFRWT